MAAAFFLVLCVSVLSILANAHYISTLNYSSDDLLSEARLTNLFDTWITRHGKSYANGEMEERQKRYQIFKSNLRFIEAHNRKDSTYKLGLNRFADLTNDEFRVQFLGSKGEVARKRLRNGVSHANVEDLKSHISLPASFDWRKEGVVTPVKDQGRCGSCWAFSSIGAIEGINAIVTGKLVSLSEQELVSCDVGGVNAGCDGGYMDDAFQWVIDHGGISSEDGYPYTSGDGKDGFCNLKLSAEKAVTIDGYVDVAPNNDEALWYAVAQQPVTVAIDGSALAFQLYSSGVFTGSCSDNPDDTDHAVLVVGWGSENGLRYWIVKNSWDSTWGMDGYIHMVRNDDPYGICSINSAPSYPTKTAGFTGRLAEA